MFDDIFSKDVSTGDIFQQQFTSLSDNVLKGFNSTVFAYGMTGAGKTYTMFGDIYNRKEGTHNPGIILISVKDLLDKIKDSEQKDRVFKVKFSFLEIYNEQVRDLLGEENTESLLIVEDQEKGVIVPDLTERSITSADQIL